MDAGRRLHHRKCCRRMKNQTKSIVYVCTFIVLMSTMLLCSLPADAQDVDKYLINTLSGHTKPISAAAFSPKGENVVTASEDGLMKVWEADSGEEIWSYTGGWFLYALDVNREGTEVLTGSLNQTAKVWILGPTITEKKTYTGHTDIVSSVRYSYDNYYVLTGSHDHTARLYERTTGFLQHEFSGHTAPVSDVAFSLDGSKALTASWDKTAKLWDTETGKLLKTFTGHKSAIFAADYSREGSIMVTGSGASENQVNIWDIETGEILYTLKGHSGPILSVALSIDGRQVLTGSADGTAKLWSTITGDLLRTLRGHKDDVTVVRFSRNQFDKRVLTGSADHTVKTWWLWDSLSIRVQDRADASAIMDATVTLNTGQTARLVGDGVYSFGYLPPDTYSVDIHHPGYHDQTIPDLVVRETYTTEHTVDLTASGPLNITSTSFSRAESGTSYSALIRMGGGKEPYTFSVAYGNLPPGLELDSREGIISGVPETPDTYTFAIGVTDAEGNYAEKEFQIVQYDPLEFNTPSVLKSAIVDQSYRQEIEVSGGKPSYTFSIVNGSLPPGMGMTSDGTLSKTPTKVGSYTFTVQVKDLLDQPHEKEFTLEVVNPIEVTTDFLIGGLVGKNYSQSLRTTGGVGSERRWKIWSGQLPEGLELDQDTGEIHGVPKRKYYGVIGFQVSDEEDHVAYKGYTLAIDYPLELLTTFLPPAVRGKEYDESIRVRGGVAPVTFDYEGHLPEGMNFDTDKGAITGIPVTTQLSNIKVIVSDRNQPRPRVIERDLNLRVTSDFGITTSSVIPTARKNVSISTVSFSTGGGPTPFRWSLKNGYLPPGIELDSSAGTLEGTPTRAGYYSFDIQVSDARSRTASKRFYWLVKESLRMATKEIPNMTVGEYFQFPFRAAGGMSPYSWKLNMGKLPSGVDLDTDTGILYGTPQRTGDYRINMQVQDSQEPIQSVKSTFNFNVINAFNLSERSVPDTLMNEYYDVTLHAQKGVPPYQWEIIEGELPPGIELEPANETARLVGKATDTGEYSFTIQLSDSKLKPNQAKRDYVINVFSPIEIETQILDLLLAEVPYHDEVVVRGGVPPYTWSVVDGVLPQGLHLDPTTGEITGVTELPLGEGESFTVEVVDSGIPQTRAFHSYYLKVYRGVGIGTKSLPPATQFQTYEQPLEGFGGSKPYAWSYDGNLPPGIQLDPNTGILSGVPTQMGTYSFTVQMVDSSKEPLTDTQKLRLTVEAADPPELELEAEYYVDGDLRGRIFYGEELSAVRPSQQVEVTFKVRDPAEGTIDSPTIETEGEPGEFVVDSSQPGQLIGKYQFNVPEENNQQEKEVELFFSTSFGQTASFRFIITMIVPTPTPTLPNTPIPTMTTTGQPTRTATPTHTSTPTIAPTPTMTSIQTGTPTPTLLPGVTPTPTWTGTPSPTPLFTPTLPGGATPTVPPWPTSVEKNEVVVADGRFDLEPLEDNMDFDSPDDRSLFIYMDTQSEEAYNWHFYVRSGLGGARYLGQSGAGKASWLNWATNEPYISSRFKNGPDFNSVYSFRMIRIDESLSRDDVFDLKHPIGYNIEGGNSITFESPRPPHLGLREIVIYDDLLGGNNLAPQESTGYDIDPPEWRAIQIAWNFGVDPSYVRDYHIQVSVDGGDYKDLGQTGSGYINYFWWTSMDEFRTHPDYQEGPQHGKTYHFRVVLVPFVGPIDNITSGELEYYVGDRIQNQEVDTENQLLVFDTPEGEEGDLTFQTDFDPVEDRNLSLFWGPVMEPVENWHIYVREGLGGYKFLGQTYNGASTQFNWSQDNPNVRSEFRKGPDFNSVYTFRAVKLDSELSPDDYYDQRGPVGFNIEGGNPLTLSQPAMPNLLDNQVAIYDDLLGGQDLAPQGERGQDRDEKSRRAIQVAWSFEDADNVRDYHVQVRVDGGSYKYLGQTMSGDITYFLWSPENSFLTTEKFQEGPQDGHSYQFRIVKLGIDGSKEALVSGILDYSAPDDATPTPLITPEVTPTPTHKPVHIRHDIPGLEEHVKPLTMVQMPAGVYMRGSTFTERSREVDEYPHEVTLSRSFSIGKYEVTQAQWEAVMGYNPSDFHDPDRPVENVSWYDSVRFCNELSRLLGRTPAYDESTWEVMRDADGFRLPYEAEWEFACRAGTTTRFSHGDVLMAGDECEPVPEHLEAMWWCGANKNAGTRAVGLLQPNPWGLHDMHGNVWELCQDWYAYYPLDPVRNPKGPESGHFRVKRGGSWNSEARYCRSANRSWTRPGFFNDKIGFRIAYWTFYD